MQVEKKKTNPKEQQGSTTEESLLEPTQSTTRDSRDNKLGLKENTVKKKSQRAKRNKLSNNLEVSHSEKGCRRASES